MRIFKHLAPALVFHLCLGVAAAPLGQRLSTSTAARFSGIWRGRPIKTCPRPRPARAHP